MEILVEKSLIPKEEIAKYEDMPDNRKLLYLRDLLKNHPNYNNLKSALNVYAGNLSEYGFDDRENPFIKFIENTKHDFNEEQTSLIRELIENGSLNPNSNWLYKPSLYNEGNDETIFKIKALTYAGNKNLQSNAEVKITPESLMGERGNIYSARTIERILGNIRVSKSSAYTIKNALERYLKDSSFNPQVIKYIKNLLGTLKLPENKADDFLSLLRDEDKFKLFIDLPVDQPTENSLIKTLKTIDLSKYLSKEDIKEKALTGIEILQGNLNDSEVTWSEFIDYLKNRFKDNYRINKFLKDPNNIKLVRDDLVKLLKAKLEVVFDEDPIQILNDKLEQTLTKYIDKQKSKDISYGDLNDDQQDALDTLVELGVRKEKAYSLVKGVPGTAEKILSSVLPKAGK